MDKLLKLYQFYSVHGTDGEKAICDWLVEYFDRLNIKVNRKGNTIWHFSPDNDVLLSAHLDQVATNGPAVHFYKTPEGSIKAYNKDWERTSLGADDKNGVWLIMKLVESDYEFDFIISEGEEVGCVGINNIEEHIKESTADYAIVLDRKGDTDILKGGSSDVYCEALAYNLKNFLNIQDPLNAYTVATGSISDTRVICKYMESVNMCVNYEDAHTKNETTNWEGLQKTLTNLQSILIDFVHYPADPSEYCKKDYTQSYSKYKKDKQSLFDYDDDDYRWRQYYGGRY